MARDLMVVSLAPTDLRPFWGLVMSVKYVPVSTRLNTIVVTWDQIGVSPIISSNNTQNTYKSPPNSLQVLIHRIIARMHTCCICLINSHNIRNSRSIQDYLSLRVATVKQLPPVFFGDAPTVFGDAPGASRALLAKEASSQRFGMLPNCKVQRWWVRVMW